MIFLLVLIGFPWPVEGTEDFYASEIIPFGEGVVAIGQAGSRLLVLDRDLQSVLDQSQQIRYGGTCGYLLRIWGHSCSVSTARPSRILTGTG